MPSTLHAKNLPTNYGSVPASNRDGERVSPSFERSTMPKNEDGRAGPYVYAGQTNMDFVRQWREEMGL
jgi:hypothetical protein